MFQIEQLHKIFKLCGSPSEEYWAKVKPPATFRPPQQYIPNFEETFPFFPRSVFSLLSSLLALDPTNRGSATSALQSQVSKMENYFCIQLDILQLSFFELYLNSFFIKFQIQFFITSPLACDLSGLPMITADEKKPVQSMDRRRYAIFTSSPIFLFTLECRKRFLKKCIFVLSVNQDCQYEATV